VREGGINNDCRYLSVGEAEPNVEVQDNLELNLFCCADSNDNDSFSKDDKIFAKSA